MRRLLSRPSPKYDLLARSYFAGLSFKSDMIFFKKGRDALIHGLELLNIKPESTVLIPAYICNPTIAPLHERGYKVVFFDIEEDLSFNFEVLESLMKSLDIQAILAPHYFGFPCNIKDLVSLCKKYDVVVIEDCAHSFLSKIDDQPVGSFGDIAIFSMRKTLAVPDGGALKLNCEVPALKYVIQPKKISFQDIYYLIQRIIEFIIVQVGRFNIYSDKFGRFRTWVTSISSTNVIGTDTNHYNNSLNPSWMLRAYLSNEPYLNQISSLRLKNFQTIIKNLNKTNINVLFEDITTGSIPQCFVLKDPTGKLVQKFKENCIGVTNWPGNELPMIVRENPQRFPIANKLNNTLVMLPIHQNISQYQIKNMLELLLD